MSEKNNILIIFVLDFAADYISMQARDNMNLAGIANKLYEINRPLILYIIEKIEYDAVRIGRIGT